jgi:phosphatidate cytidylyltransferase
VLRTRVLTALLLLPAAFLLIFWLPPAGFAIAAALLLFVGSLEFSKLAALESRLARLALPAVQAALFVLLARTRGQWSAHHVTIFMAACLAWLPMLLQLRFYRAGQGPSQGYRVRSFINALLAVTACWMALGWLRFQPDGEWWILVLLLTVWAADTGAYFVGRQFGHRKLAPHISPGKTTAGLWGGILLAAGVAAAAVYLIPQLDAGLPAMAGVGLLTAAASVGGDLFVSMHKRTVGCKDTGSLFPGHGGVLDRLDSLLAGAPFFVAGMHLAGI